MVKKTFTQCFIKNRSLLKNKKVQRRKISINLYTKDENEGNGEYGNDFIKCKIFHDSAST